MSLAKLVGQDGSPNHSGSQHDLPSTKELLKDPSISYLRELTSPTHAEVDLVAVHGLNWSNAAAFGVRTWTAGDKGRERLWLKDFLPHRLPNVRVLLYGYNSNVAFRTSKVGVGDIAEDLLQKLWSKRQVRAFLEGWGNTNIDQALVVKAKYIPRYQAISLSAKTFAFFATPHQGGHGAGIGQAAAALVRHVGMNPRNGFMEALRKDSHVAPDIHNDFLEGQSNYHICSFYECQRLPFVSDLIVEKSSAVLGLGTLEIRVPCPNANHSSICKFASENDDYRFVIDEIEALVEWAIGSAPALPASMGQLSIASSITHRNDYSTSEPRRSLAPPGSFIPPSIRKETNLFDEKSVSPFQEIPAVNRPPRKGPFFLVPFDQNFNFVGHSDILSRLSAFHNLSVKPGTRCALYGLGGVGKTQIALEHSYRYQRDNPDHSVFWVYASDVHHLHESLGLIASHCRISRTDDPTDVMLARVKHWLSERKNGSWMMIVDNADSEETFSKLVGGDQGSQAIHPTNPSSSARVNSYIPDCTHGKVILTTNNQLTARALAGNGHILEVLSMNQQNACALLRKYLANGESGATYGRDIYKTELAEDLATLARRLDSLPLALVQAVAYINITSLSVEEYLELIAKNEASIPGVLEAEGPGHERSFDLSKAFMKTWKVAFDQIEITCRLAAETLSLVAFYDAERIPKALFSHFQTGGSQSSVQSLEKLVAYSFIKVEPKAETFSVHRLVQLAMRKRLDASYTEKKWAVKALRLLSENFPIGDYESWEMCTALVPHALKILSNELYGPTEAIPLGILQSKLSWYYLGRGFFAQADIWSCRAVNHMISAPDVKQSDVLAIKAKRIMVLQKLGHFDNAEDLAQEVWRARKSTLGAKHEDTLQSFTTLCLVYQVLGRYAEGETAMRKIIKNLERSCDLDDAPVLAAKQRLATILWNLGCYAEAEDFARAAIKGYEKNSGARHPDTLKSYWVLAQIYLGQGKDTEAEEMDMETWTVQKQVLGVDSHETLKSQYALSNDLQAQSKFAAAEAHKREIYHKSICLVGPTHFYTLTVAAGLASCITASAITSGNLEPNRLAEAEALYQLSLNGREKFLPLDHLEILAVRTDLAALRRLRGQVPLPELEASERDTLAKLKKLVGKTHPFTVRSQDNLARILWLQRHDSAKRKEALKKAKAVFEITEQRLGWAKRGTWSAAELVVEMSPPEGREGEELARKIAFWRNTIGFA